jgi:hypothetical protein
VGHTPLLLTILPQKKRIGGGNELEWGRVPPCQQQKKDNKAAFGMHAVLLSCTSSPTLYSLLTPFPPSHFALLPSTMSNSDSTCDMASLGALSASLGGSDVALLGSFVKVIGGSDMASSGGFIGIVGGCCLDDAAAFKGLHPDVMWQCRRAVAVSMSLPQLGPNGQWLGCLTVAVVAVRNGDGGWWWW